jgi:hypothetical protein
MLQSSSHVAVLMKCSLLQFLNAGSFFGRALSGPCAERYGAIQTFVTSGILSGVVLLALWTTSAVGTAGTIIGAFLYGLFSGESLRNSRVNMNTS